VRSSCTAELLKALMSLTQRPSTPQHLSGSAGLKPRRHRSLRCRHIVQHSPINARPSSHHNDAVGAQQLPTSATRSAQSVQLLRPYPRCCHRHHCDQSWDHTDVTMPTPTAWAYGIRPRCAGIAYIAIITGEHKIRPYVAMMAMTSLSTNPLSSTAE